MTGRVFALALAAAAAGCAFAAPALASDKSEVTATVKRWVANFNKGDMKAFLAACAPQAVIIDELPPHVWQGATACSDWWNANDANNKQLGATGGTVTIGKPWHVDITGDRAYFVTPAKYTDKEKGKTVTQSAVWTVTLQKTSTGWSMTGSAWAEH